MLPILAYVPFGQAMDNPVLINFFPLEGIMHSSTLYRSYPAAPTDPFFGMMAFSMSFLTSSILEC